MEFIALKTEDGKKKGRIAFCCKMLGVSRQGFYRYLANRNRPWKYQRLAEIMQEICNEDQCNDTYGRMRMYQALQLKNPDGVKIPEEKTVYRIMKKIGLTHHPKRKPNGITKADREAMKSDDLLKRDFCSDEPLKIRHIRLFRFECFGNCHEYKHEGGVVRSDIGQRNGFLSGFARCYPSFRPRCSVYKRSIPQSNRSVWYLPKYE